MSREKLRDFDGRQLTLKQIQQLVPFLSDRSVRTHLAAGRNTIQAITTYDSLAAMRAGAKRGKQKSPYR